MYIRAYVIIIICTYTGARNIPTFYNNYVIVDKEGKVAI